MINIQTNIWKSIIFTLIYSIKIPVNKQLGNPAVIINVIFSKHQEKDNFISSFYIYHSKFCIW